MSNGGILQGVFWKPQGFRIGYALQGVLPPRGPKYFLSAKDANQIRKVPTGQCILIGTISEPPPRPWLTRALSGFGKGMKLFSGYTRSEKFFALNGCS